MRHNSPMKTIVTLRAAGSVAARTSGDRSGAAPHRPVRSAQWRPTLKGPQLGHKGDVLPIPVRKGPSASQRGMSMRSCAVVVIDDGSPHWAIKKNGLVTCRRGPGGTPSLRVDDAERGA